MNWKSFWTWMTGILAGPLTIYSPYIAQFDFSRIPREAHGAAVISILTGLGLIQMKRPQDHQTPGEPQT